MGEAAAWRTAAGDITGRVLFKDPTEPVKIGDGEQYEYRPNTATAEYYKGSFAGLKERVDSGAPQYLTVRGQAYLVAQVLTKYDGDTHVAHLAPHAGSFLDP
jgi:hypothetical protein